MAVLACHSKFTETGTDFQQLTINEVHIADSKHPHWKENALEAVSEVLHPALCNQEYAYSLEQGLDDKAEPVIAQGEALGL